MPYPARPVADRLWEKVIKLGPDDCWIWTGSTSAGYGRIGVRRDRKGWTRGVHRLAYELTVGPIPEGLTIDHLCRTPLCCNPRHLEPVTNAVNLQRRHAAQTHCKRGHEFTPENTYPHPKDGARVCRTCDQARRRRTQLTPEQKARRADQQRARRQAKAATA